MTMLRAMKRFGAGARVASLAMGVAGLSGLAAMAQKAAPVAVRLDQPKLLPGPRPSQATIREWKERKFGMFIHFGLYSALGGVWQGKQIDNGLSEQIMGNAPIPVAEYEKLAATFDPEKFDPDAIVALAKSAGMKFIVITSKHHDGFNMFATKQTKYNIVDATPYHKDVVKLMEEACRRAGMKFGVYYSSIDWHYPGASSYIEGNSNPIPAAHEAFNVAQLKELASNYGPLSEIWFDMGKPTPAQSEHFTRAVHDLQPQTMVSGRVFNYEGDFTVMGDNQVPAFVIDEPWQTPASIFPDTWGYRSWEKREDLDGKIHENVLRLAQVVSRGGNFILNIGPKGDGSIVPYEADVLKGIGRWMQVNGEAIYGAEPQPFRQLDFGYATVKPGKLYLMVRDAAAIKELRLPGLTTKLKHACLLGDPQCAGFAITQDAAGASISMTHFDEALKRAKAAGKSSILPVVMVTYDGPMRVVPKAIAAQTDGRVVLKADAADHFMNYNGYGYEDPSTLYKLRWMATARPGAYRVTVRYEAEAKPAPVELVVGGKHVVFAPATASGVQEMVLPGAVTLGAGDTAIELTPKEPFYKGTPLGVKVEELVLTPQ